MTSPTLEDALAAYRIELPDDQVRCIDQYVLLLWDWNQKLNLTRHTDYDRFVQRDVVDSLAVANLLRSGESVLDVGSGGGVPGLLLAMLRPDVRVSVSESTQKKANVLRQLVTELELPVEVYPERAEQVLDIQRFDTLTLRAVGPLSKILRWFEPHWPAIGRLLMIKGPRWVEERGDARHHGLMQNLSLRCLATYPLAGTESDSVVLGVWRSERDHLFAEAVGKQP